MLSASFIADSCDSLCVSLVTAHSTLFGVKRETDLQPGTFTDPFAGKWKFSIIWEAWQYYRFPQVRLPVAQRCMLYCGGLRFACPR